MSDYLTEHRRRTFRQAEIDTVNQMQHAAARASYAARTFADYPHNESQTIYQQRRSCVLYAAARAATGFIGEER